MQELNHKDMDILEQFWNGRLVDAQLCEKDENVILKINKKGTNCDAIHASSEQGERKTKEENLNVKPKMFANVQKAEKTNWTGVLFALLAGGFFTISSAGLRASRGIDTMELLVIRSLIQVAILVPLALWNGESFLGPKGHRVILLLQGLIGGLALVMRFYSFRLLPLGDATTISFSSSVVVMIISFIFLKEPCGFFRVIIVCPLLIGVVLISKPPFLFHTANNQPYNVLGYLTAILGTLLKASHIVVVRKCKDIHFSVQVLQMSLWSLFIATAIVIWNQQFSLPEGTKEWSLVGVVVIFGLSAQVLTAKALSLEQAGRVAVIRFFNIVLAYLLQVYLFGEKPDNFSIIGAVLVTLSVILGLIK